MKKNLFVIALLLMCVYSDTQTANLAKTSAGFAVNYSKDAVGSYVLPGLLTLNTKTQRV